MSVERFRKNVQRCAAVAGAALLMAATPVFAAKEETTDAGGGATPPTPGSEVETGWNPHPICDVIAGWTLYDLLSCLAVGIDPRFDCPPPDDQVTLPPDPGEDPEQNLPLSVRCGETRGEYRVTMAPGGRGIEIVRLVPDATGSTEPYSLLLKENDPAIESTKVQVNRPHLNARIREIDGAPESGATLEVTLNEQTIRLDIIGLTSAAQLTSRLITEIRNRNFFVTYTFPDIWVTRDNNQASHGLTKLGFKYVKPAGSTSAPGIVKSEIQLTPDQPGTRPEIHPETLPEE